MKGIGISDAYFGDSCLGASLFGCSGFAIFPQSEEARVPRPRFLRVGVLVCDAGEIEAVLRSGRLAFCHV